MQRTGCMKQAGKQASSKLSFLCQAHWMSPTLWFFYQGGMLMKTCQPCLTGAKKDSVCLQTRNRNRSSQLILLPSAGTQATWGARCWSPPLSKSSLAGEWNTLFLFPLFLSCFILTPFHFCYSSSFRWELQMRQKNCQSSLEREISLEICPSSPSPTHPNSPEHQFTVWVLRC